MDDIAPSLESQQNSYAVFPLAIEKSLIDDFGLSPGTIAEAAKNYFAAQPLIPGAPLISELSSSDGIAVLEVQNRADDENWEQFKERVLADDQQLIRLRDPYMPNWTGKEKASICAECTQCTSEQQQRIDAECNRSKPVLNDKILNIVGTPPASSRIMEKMIGPRNCRQHRPVRTITGPGTRSDFPLVYHAADGSRARRRHHTADRAKNGGGRI